MTFSDSTAGLYEGGSGKELALFPQFGRPAAISFSADGGFFATVADEKTVQLRESASGKEVAHVVLDRRVESVSVGAGGRVLAVEVSSDASIVSQAAAAVRLIEASSGREIARFDQGSVAGTIAFSPDGLLMTIGFLDRTIRVYLSASGKEIVRVLRDHPVDRAMFSRDSKYIIATQARSAGWEAEAQLIEIATGREVLRRTLSQGDEASQFLMGLDRVAVATSKEDGIHVSHVLYSPQGLVDAAKDNLQQCLTQDQRKEYFLPPAPPHWCIERRLPPYDTDEWQAWLAAKKAGGSPALPAE